MIIRENIKNTVLFAYLTSLLAQACELGLNILVFGQLSVGDVGTYGLIMSVVTFFIFALDLGLDPVILRGFSQQKIAFREALLGSAALRIPMAILGIIIISAWVHYSSAVSAQEWLPLALAMATSTLLIQRTLAISWLRAHDKQTIANAILLLYPLGKFVSGLLLIKLHRFNLVYFFGAILLTEGLITILAYWSTGKLKSQGIAVQPFSRNFIKHAVKALWRPGVFFSLIGLCTVLQNRLDWMLVYAYVSKTELAYYSLANKIYEIFNSYIGIATATLFPWLCKIVQAEDNNPMLVIGVKGLTFASVLAAGVVAFYAPVALKFIWGNKFEPANHLIYLIMCGGCLCPICALTYYHLIALNHENYLLVTVVIATIAQFIVNLLIIPKIGGLGATLGMITMVSVTLTSFIIICIKLKIIQSIGFQRILFFSVMMLGTLVMLKWQVTNELSCLIFYIIFNIFFGIMILFKKDELFYCIHKLRLLNT